MDTSSNQFNGNTSSKIPAHILDDLCSRFIINIPEEERHDVIRVFFQIELAHWFYLDFYCQENPDLKGCGIKDFSAHIFQHCPTLMDQAGNLDKILESWREYKMAVPTYGAILLDGTLEYCLLVQGFWTKTSWGFPKGKVNEQELASDCAIREVLEETGFDISKLINPDDYIEYKMIEQLSRLYLIAGVSMDTKFQPRTRNEIRKLDWFRIDWLPSHKKDTVCKQHYNLNPNAFFMVIPFIKSLRKWIGRKQQGGIHTSQTTVTSKSAKHHTPTASKARDVVESIPADAHLCQQQTFAEQMQAEFLEYLPQKEAAARAGSRTRSASPPPCFTTTPSSGKKQQLSSNKQSSNSTGKKQILKRDTTSSSDGVSRKLFPANVTDGAVSSQYTARQMTLKAEDGFFSSALANFVLDHEAVMAAMFPVRPNAPVSVGSARRRR